MLVNTCIKVPKNLNGFKLWKCMIYRSNALFLQHADHRFAVAFTRVCRILTHHDPTGSSV